MTQKERRRSPRTHAKLAMEIKLSGKDYARVESINVSANGVYFSSPVHIPTMTKLQITLVLPAAGDRSRTQEVDCEGVVVRAEPETPSKNQENYQIACFFTAISEKARDSLESYILAQLTF